jgi:parallel beta-helix repeat protein
MGKMRSKTLAIILFNLVILSSLVIIFLDESGEAAGNEIYVDDDYYLTSDGSAEHPYRSIQQAINLADEGDTIYVFGGLYNETLLINKRLTIIGSIDDGNTILDYGISHKYTVEITADKVILEAFNITDAGDNIISYVKGALIRVTSNNVIIQRNNLTQSNNGWCIYLDSSDGAVIGDNFINDTTVGIYLSSSDTNDLISNRISNCTDAAVGIYYSSNNRLYNNTFNNSNYGVYIRDCTGTNFSDNKIKNNKLHGIGIYKSSDTTLMNNTILKSTDGIHLGSSNSDVIGNSVEGNQIGINLDSSGCQIVGNSINNSTSAGIYASSASSDNIIYLNSFINNTVNAKEYGNNEWYYASQGNYWDDYTEIDRDEDGIGDLPYYITGGAVDLYPVGYFLKPPDQPTEPYPGDYDEDIGLKVTFNVSVYDPDSELIDVYFYNAVDHSLIGVDKTVFRGKWAECTYTIPFDTTFFWYAVAKDDLSENQSYIWYVTTRARPPENKKPVADAGGPYAAIIDEFVVFDASGSSDPDGNINFYRWNFGDGTSEILDSSPEHKYSEPGTYEVTLTVIDNDGTSAIGTTMVIITEFPTSFEPVADIGGPYYGEAGKIVSFNGSDSYDLDGTIVNYTWNFGDGTKDYGVNTNHVYAAAGEYAVTLTVTDNESLVGSESTTATISPPEGLPGFEFIFIIIALALIVLWRRHRK